MLLPNIELSTAKSMSFHFPFCKVILGLGPPQTYSPELRHSTFFFTKSFGILACPSTLMIASPFAFLIAIFHPHACFLWGLSYIATLLNCVSSDANSVIILFVLSADAESTRMTSISL